ncbi:hypothetical protein EJ07DRAFT_180322 [Lizonia empirigonia]|nr:hypothetical protein EJ07DRAFT_180322 [Lizonia empirigonia]
MPLRDHIRTLFNRPTRLTRTSTLITAAQGNLPSKLGTWKCACGHLNAVYHLPLHAHPLGILSCRACGLTWHPRSNKIVPSPASYLHVNILLPRYGPGYEEHGGEAYILPTPRDPGAAEDGGYGLVLISTITRCAINTLQHSRKSRCPLAMRTHIVTAITIGPILDARKWRREGLELHRSSTDEQWAFGSVVVIHVFKGGLQCLMCCRLVVQDPRACWSIVETDLAWLGVV